MPPTVKLQKLLLAGTRLVWAAAVIGFPNRLIDAAGGSPDRRSRRVARILGARHAIQGSLELASWPRWSRAGIVVDGLHAITAAGLGALDPDRRRVALTDTAIASTFALLGRHAALRTEPATTG